MLVLRCYMQHCNRKVASRLRKPLVVSHCLNLTVSRWHEIVIPYISRTKRLKSEKAPQRNAGMLSGTRPIFRPSIN